MLKRKNTEKRKFGFIPFSNQIINLLMVSSLGLGLLCLVIVSVTTMSAWIKDRTLPTPTSGLTGTVAPTLNFKLPPNAQLIISTRDSDILYSVDGQSFEKTGLKGNDVAVSPDRSTLAYWRDGRTFIFREGREHPLKIGAREVYAQWSRFQPLLAITLWDIKLNPEGDLYRYRADNPEETSAPTRIFHDDNISGPMIANPDGTSFLFVHYAGFKRAEFYTLSAQCFREEDCLKTKALVATLPYNVSWISYHPDGKHVIFTEGSGNIYQLDLVTQEITALVVDSTKKLRPSINKDGTRLAFLDDSGQLYVYNLVTQNFDSISRLDVASVDWLQ